MDKRIDGHRSVAIALVGIALLLAGCADSQESTAGDDLQANGDAVELSIGEGDRETRDVAMDGNATEVTLHAEATSDADGDAAVAVVVQEGDRVLASALLHADANDSATLTANVTDPADVRVIVQGVEGEATVVLRATAPAAQDEREVVVIEREVLVNRTVNETSPPANDSGADVPDEPPANDTGTGAGNDTSGANGTETGNATA